MAMAQKKKNYQRLGEISDSELNIQFFKPNRKVNKIEICQSRATLIANNIILRLTEN